MNQPTTLFPEQPNWEAENAEPLPTQASGQEGTTRATALLESLAAVRLDEAFSLLAANDPTSGRWVRVSYAIPTDAYVAVAHRATDERLSSVGNRRTQNDLALIAVRQFLLTAPLSASEFIETVPRLPKSARSASKPATVTLTIRVPVALAEYLTALAAFTSTSAAQLVAASLLAAKKSKAWE